MLDWPDDQLHLRSAITGVATSIVATPAFSPAAGTYTSTQSVTLSTSTSGASIYYTTDGSTPTPLSLLYVGPISVASPQTIKAIGVLAGWGNSAVASAAYMIYNAIPVGLASTSGTPATMLSITVDVVASLVVVKLWFNAMTATVTFGGSSMTLGGSITGVGSPGTKGNSQGDHLLVPRRGEQRKKTAPTSLQKQTKGFPWNKSVSTGSPLLGIIGRVRSGTSVNVVHSNLTHSPLAPGH